MLQYAAVLAGKILLEDIDESFRDVWEGYRLCIFVDSGDIVVGVRPLPFLDYLGYVV
jgi:hypothetical protein